MVESVTSSGQTSVGGQGQLGLQAVQAFWAIQQALVNLGVDVKLVPVSFTVASLPTTGNGSGQIAWASNGRKPAEGSGAGTGVPVFWNPSNSEWYSFLSGVQVTS